MASYYPKYYYHDSVGMAQSWTRPTFHERLIDFAVQPLHQSTNDLAYMLAIPAFTFVQTVNYQTVATVLTATGTFSIQSQTVGTTYVATATAVAVGSYGTQATLANATVQQWYSANDDITIESQATANLVSGQLKVFMLCVYPQPYTYKDVDGTVHTSTFTDRNNWQATAPVIPT